MDGMPNAKLTTLKAMETAAPPPRKLQRLKQEQVDLFHRTGILLVEKLFSPEEVRLLKEASLTPGIEDNTGAVIDSTGNNAELFVFGGEPQDIMGAFVRVARLVEMTEDLLGEEIYHWHSKFTFKPPRSIGRWDWHQDYGSWYKDGCLWTGMLSAMIAVDPQREINGCVQLVPGSHLMGRVDHPDIGETNGAEPDRVKRVIAERGIVLCEIDPGDVVFFHGNTLHASGPNRSEMTRTLFMVSYNVASNPPANNLIGFHGYHKLEKLPDSTLLDGSWSLAPDAAMLEKRKQIREERRKQSDGKGGYGLKSRSPDEVKAMRAHQRAGE